MLSVNINKMYKYKIKTSFFSPKMPKQQANKTGFHIRKGSYPQDIYRFRSHRIDDIIYY